MRQSPSSHEGFFSQAGTLNADELRHILWNAYGRGTAALRERIEEALDASRRAERLAAKRDRLVVSDGQGRRGRRGPAGSPWNEHAYAVHEHTGERRPGGI